jgi:hypothetical protein
VQTWKCQSEAQRAAFKEEERKQNQAIIEQTMNLRYPSRGLKHPDHMHIFVNANIDAWVMDSTTIMYRPISMTSDEETIPVQSQKAWAASSIPGAVIGHETWR